MESINVVAAVLGLLLMVWGVLGNGIVSATVVAGAVLIGSALIAHSIWASRSQPPR